MKHYYQVAAITATPFDNPHVKKIISDEVRYQSKLVKPFTIKACDPFARTSWLTSKPQGLESITNDIDTNMPTDYHLEAKDFAKKMHEDGHRFDLILFDPPYNLTQLKRKYDGIGKDLELWQTNNPFGECKDILSKCLTAGGSIISFGFSSKGFGHHRGLEKIALYNFEMPGGLDRYNVQVVVERKYQRSLF